MTRAVVLDARATDQLAGFLRDDAEGVRAVLIAVDALVGDPWPPSSSRIGDERRLRVGRYRVYYRFEGDIIEVRRVGRVERR